MTAISSSDTINVDYVVCERTHRVIYTLISNYYATLKDINTYYSIEEVIDMYEACLVKLHNKAAGLQSIQK